MIRKSAFSFVFCLSASFVAVACGSPPAAPVPPVALPEPRASGTSAPEVPEPPAPVAPPSVGKDDGKDAGTNARDGGASGDAGWEAPSDAGTLRTGPVLDDTDAVARAFRPANVALDKAYAEFVKKAQVAPSHTGAWTRSAPSVVKGNAKVGWDVTFSSFPPAGFSHEALVHVGPKGDVTVKKAVASFSPD